MNLCQLSSAIGIMIRDKLNEELAQEAIDVKKVRELFRKLCREVVRTVDQVEHPAKRKASGKSIPTFEHDPVLHSDAEYRDR
jgi:hypothetical protein